MPVAIYDETEIKTAVDELNHLREEVLYEDKNADPWEALSQTELAWIEGEIGKCCADFRYAAYNYFWLGQTKEASSILLKLWPTQELFLSVVLNMWQEGEPAWIIVHKGRQVGISTVIEAILAWKNIFFSNQISMIIAQDPDQAEHLLKISLYIMDHMPWWMRPMEQSREFKEAMILENRDPGERSFRPGLNNWIIANGCTKVSAFGQGKPVHVFHGCFHPDQNVITRDFFIKQISAMQTVPFVKSPSHRDIGVKKFWRGKAAELYEGAEHGYKITTWCNSAFPIVGTGCHRIVGTGVYNGWKRTKQEQVMEFRLDEFSSGKVYKGAGMANAVAVPIREISEGGTLPPQQAPRILTRGGRIAPRFYPKPSREWGFCVGLYLAEGSVQRQNRDKTKYSSLNISLDMDEEFLADRFSRATGVPRSKPRRPKDKSNRSRTYQYHNSDLARWFCENFGSTDGKRLPEFCWTMGREFLSGIVEGMITGDGHINKIREVYFSTTRAQLAIGLREAVLSIGHGYSSIKNRPAGFYFGRNCQEIWTVVFCNQVSDSLRGEYGWKEQKKSRNSKTSHWKYSSGRDYVILRVRSVERVELGEVCDIEVDSEDRLYLLPSAISHNSELSSWPSDRARKIMSQDMKYAFARRPGCLAVMESKPRGVTGWWYNQWHVFDNQGLNAKFFPFFVPSLFEGSRQQTPPPTWQLDEDAISIRENFSIAWDECNVCKTPLPKRWGTLEECIRCGSKDISPYMLTDRQLCWYQEEEESARLEGSQELKDFYQEMAITPEQGFQSSAMIVFPDEVMAYLQLSCHPGQKGYFDDAFNWHSERNCKICHDDHLGEEYPSSMWEAPVDGAIYVAGVDVAEGEEEGDFSVIHVIKIGYGFQIPDKQVFEWYGHIDGHEFARVCYLVGKAYNNAMLAIDAMGPGYGTLGLLLQQFQYSNIYRWKHLDSFTKVQSNKAGVWTNYRTRRTMITWGIRWLRRKIWEVKSTHFLEEAPFFAKDDDDAKAEAIEGHHDDAIMAGLYANYAAHEDDHDPMTGRFNLPAGQARPQEGGRYTAHCVKGHKFETDDPGHGRCPVVNTATGVPCGSLILGAEKKEVAETSLAQRLTGLLAAKSEGGDFKVRSFDEL